MAGFVKVARTEDIALGQGKMVEAAIPHAFGKDRPKNNAAG